MSAREHFEPDSHAGATPLPLETPPGALRPAPAPHDRATRARHFWLVMGFLALATALCFYALADQSLWFDEGISAHIAKQPILQVLLGVDSNHPPLYYLLLNLFQRLAGDELFTLRAVSVLLGVLAIPVIYRLACALFSQTAGLYAALLAACSPLLWWASQELRMYSLLALLVALAALAWHRLLVAPTRRRWLALWAVELLLLYAHNTGPIQALWLNAVTLLAWLVRRSPRSPPWRTWWRTWFAGQAVILLLWSPWLLTHFVKVPQGRGVIAPPELGLALFSGMWQVLWTGTWALVGKEPILVALCALLFPLTLLIAPWDRPAGRWLALHALVLAGGLLAGLLLAGITLHGRYLVMIAPLVVVLLAGGLARLHERGPLPPRARPALALLALAPFLLAFGLSVYLATHNPAYARDDVRGMVQHYAAALTADDAVLVWSRRDRFDFEYYWDRLGVRAQRVVLPPGAELEELVPLLPRRGALSLNVWYGERSDYRQMLPCLLAHGTTDPPDKFTVYGLADFRYASGPPATPALRPFDAPFSVARVTALGELAAFSPAQSLCVPVRVDLLQRTTRDLKAVLIAKNALGWEIARADAIFARPDQLTSSRLAPGATLTAFPLLRLPYGTPAGTYTVTLRLYDEGNLSGYDLLGAAGTPAGKDLIVGVWPAAPEADWARVRRSTDLPVAANLKVAGAAPASPGDELTLSAHDAGGTELLHNGSWLRLSLLWQGTGALPDLVLAAEDGSWRVTLPAAPRAHGPIVLDWREARVPAEAAGGPADLQLADGTLIARYTVEALPAAFVAPDFATPLGAELPGVGALAGFTLVGQEFARSEPLSITLVWQAGLSTPETSYTVFVHVLAADGRLIGQSDTLPAEGARPTIGWRPGEYIVDVHRVFFNTEAGPGPATLAVGLYNAETGLRLPFADGSDRVVLPAAIRLR